MKKMQKQQYRVSDFENAIRKSDLNIQVSEIHYFPNTLYVKEIIGFVEQNNRGIRIVWNSQGKASIACERTPEFDINL